MEQKIERTKMLAQFERDMRINEKSPATIEEYLRDVRGFIRYVGEDGMITKNVVITYKQHLLRWYAVTSANSMLAAVNYFLRSVGSEDCVVKTFKVQKAAFREKERELTKAEYLRHLFAVTYYNRERDICHLADLLGHSNINTTRVYTLVSYEEQEQQINRLGLL